MPAVKTGMTPPPMPGMPAPMQPMGGMPPSPGMPSAPPPNPFAPMPPMPLAGGPPPQMPQGQPMPQVQGQQMQGSTAGRRRRFGDALEGMLGRNQGLGAAMPQPQRAMPPQMMPQQRMVAPGTPMMRTPPMPSMMPRPMEMGGEVDIFGYADGGPVVQYYEGAGEVERIDQIYEDLTPAQKFLVTNEQLRKMDDSTGRFGRSEFIEGSGIGTDYLGYSEDPTKFYDTSNVDDIYANLTMAQKIAVTNPQLLMLAEGTGSFDGNRFVVDDDVVDLIANDDDLGGDDLGGDDVVVSQPVSTITGAESGAGSAVGAGGNFGTGSYTADAVDPSEINAIDYSQFTGDIGSTTGGYDVVDPETGVVTAGTREQAALFGPKVNIPTSISQYMTDPVTGGLTTSYGPEMVATSPIGAIKLPARPVSIDIFDFLSTPTYGTMYSGIDAGDVDLYEYGGMKNMRMGGEVSGPFGGSSVPREAMIADQPHMLAYINQDEEALLRSFGGSGIAGPGGIPSYPPGTTGYGSGEGTGYGSSISATRDRLKAMAKSDDKSSIDDVFGTGNIFTEKSPGASTVDFGTNTSSDDEFGEDYTPTSAELAAQLEAQGLTNITPGPLSVEDQVAQYNLFGDDYFAEIPVGPSGTSYEDLISGDYETFNPARGEDIPDILATRADLDADQAAADVMESAINLGVLDDTILGPGEGGLSAPVNLPAPVVNAPVVYTDRRGNQYDSQAAADYSDRAFAAQLASYGAGKEGFDSFADQVSKPYIPREESDRAASRIYTDNFRPELAQYRGPDILGGIYSDIEAIGGLPPLGDTRGGVSGVQPGYNITSMNDPNITQSMRDEEYIMMENPDRYLLGSDNILDLNTPALAGRNLDADMDPFDRDRVTNVPLTDDDMGLPSGPVSDLERGLGAPSTVQDVAPPEAGYTSLSEIKNRISRAEGTADEGGYGRLLGGQEGRFGVDLTNMTVQEVLDFQKLRGPGSYAEYSQGVNTQRGMTRADGTGVISTPAGKYQVVGSTLQSLVNQGIVDPNAKFDEGTQERIGTHLVMNDLAGGKGLSDLKSGKLTPEEFEAALGKQFEGISRGLDKGAGSTALTIGAASETGRQVEQGRRDDNVEKIRQQIGDQAEPTGIESIFYEVIGGLGFGLGKPLADKLRGSSRENRQAIIDQHVYALQNGATPKTDEDGNYIGFDISTMDTFANKVLAADDIMAFMPPSSGTYNNPAYQADADGDGVSDYDRFQQVFGAQSTAADVDPTGMSTEQGFITSDGKEFFVDAGGNVVEVTDGTVPLEVGGGQSVVEALGVTETTTGGDDGSEEIKNYTTDDGGNKICNDEGYVYNSETDMCEPPAEEEKSDTVSSPIGIGIPSSRRFDDIMASITTPAPKIAPISANIRPMQDGGMAGLNRTADNFLKALAG